MSSNLVFETATAATEPQLRQLLRDNPVSGEIHVSLEREPSALHAAKAMGDRFQLLLVFDGRTRNLVASGGRFELQTYINGISTRTGYLAELRFDGGLRQRKQLLFGSYRAMRSLHDSGNTPFYLTTIIADNYPARRLLEAGLGDMPTYRPLERLVTLALPVKAAKVRGGAAGNVIQGHDSQLGEIAELMAKRAPRYQFHPVWPEETLHSRDRCPGLSAGDFLTYRDGDSLRACLALWDQRSFKQTVIQGYSRRLARLRPAFNAVAPLISRPRLPGPGARLESAFLSHICIDPDDEHALVAMVGQACQEAKKRGLDYVMLAFAERHPLTRVIRKHFPSHAYVSVIYVVYWEDGAEAVDSLDGRMPHPEVAIL